jgi:putative DNA primase/helicase
MTDNKPSDPNVLNDSVEPAPRATFQLPLGQHSALEDVGYGGAQPRLAPKATPKAVSKAILCLSDAKALDTKSFKHQGKGYGQMLPATIPNLAHILDAYGVSVRYNVIKKKTEIRLPAFICTTDNADNVALTHIVSLAATNNMPTGQIPMYVEALADSNSYNPVAEWIKLRPWDGQDRLDAIIATITTKDGFPLVLKRSLIYRWLLSCVAAALMDRGFKARGVLTLQGPQGCGKTSWVISLVSDAALRETVIKVDHHLDGNNKDSILTAICHWIVEIGELDSSFKKDIARLKGFLTSDQDKLRRPYARGDSEYARRTVFCATVNEHNFLIDMTGNSRWWTIPVKSVNFKHGIDMQQVYAQLTLDYERGEQWWLTAPEEAMLETQNKEHQAVNVIGEQMRVLIDFERAGTLDDPAMAAIDVLRELDYEKPTNGQCRDCAAILREHFGEPKKIKGIMKWRIPKAQQFNQFPDLPESVDLA